MLSASYPQWPSGRLQMNWFEGLLRSRLVSATQRLVFWRTQLVQAVVPELNAVSQALISTVRCRTQEHDVRDASLYDTALAEPLRLLDPRTPG